MVILYRCEPCDTGTYWWSFPTCYGKHRQNLLSIYVVVHWCSMPEERNMQILLSAIRCVVLVHWCWLWCNSQMDELLLVTGPTW